MLMSWRLSVGSWKPGSWNETNNQLWCSCNRGVRGWEWNCERQSQTEVSYERQHVRSRAAFSEASLQTRRDAFALSDTKCMQTLGNSWCNRENDTVILWLWGSFSRGSISYTAVGGYALKHQTVAQMVEHHLIGRVVVQSQPACQISLDKTLALSCSQMHPPENECLKVTQKKMWLRQVVESAFRVRLE